jgi:hypothetical protein
MLRIPQLAFALGAILVLSLPRHADTQSNSTLRPSTDHSVTTGIGSSSSFKNVPPPPGEPSGQISRPLIWVLPEADEKPAQEQGGGESGEASKAAAVPDAKATEAPPENPRTMITRDRIESPQHR